MTKGPHPALRSPPFFGRRVRQFLLYCMDFKSLSVKVLGAQAVEGSRVSPLEGGPEALNPVGVDASPDILLYRVLD